MINNLSLFFKKYFVPVVFLVIGILILILGVTNDQGAIFMFSSVLMLGAGAISILYSLGRLKPILVYSIGGIMGIIAIVSLYMSYESVAITEKYNNDSAFCFEKAKQNLMDISYIQKSYKEKNGVYLKTWEELVDYVKNGTVPNFVSEGVVPVGKITPEERDYLYGDNRPIDKSMTEEEAYRLSKWKEGPRHDIFKGFVRDTIQVSMMTSKFKTRSYVDNRTKMGMGQFYPDSLPYIPFTNGKEKWKMEVKDSINFNDAVGPALFISGTLPFAKAQGSAHNIFMTLGNLSTFEHTGSWEKE